MDPNLITPLFTLLGTLVGGLVTFAVTRLQFKHQLQALPQQYKTEFMAEETPRHFLNPKSFTDRSFDVLKFMPWPGTGAQRFRAGHQRSVPRPVRP